MHNGLSLARMIMQYFDFDSDSKEFSFIYLNSVKYILHHVSASEFNRRVKIVSKKSAKDFRLMLSNSGYCTFLLKLHVIDALANTRTKNFNIKASRKKFKIKKTDRLILDTVYKDKEIKQRVAAIVKEFGNKGNMPTMEEITATLVEVLKRMEARINNIVRKKLHFIVSSNNMDDEDMKVELRSKLIQSYYWSLPANKSLEHWTMSMNSILTNATINLIEHWTYQKRARMFKDTDGSFKLRESTSNVKIAGDEDDFDVQVEDHEISKTFERNIFSSISTEQLWKKFVTTEKRSLIFKVMMGIYDESFTDWLKAEKYITRTQDNSDFQDAVDNYDFLATVARFVKMKTKKFFRLIERMRIALNQYNRGDDTYGYAAAA